MTRIIGLDVLRGLAILLVLIWHWIPESYGINYFYNGKLGVTIFFILSGYLISKGLYESKQVDFKSQLYNFYINRFLRIFPIYYLLLVFLILINYSSIRSVQAWYWLYGVNILIEKTNHFVPYTIHFWSLSVEEQFYILWPALFLYFSKFRKLTRQFLLSAIVVSLLCHLYNSSIDNLYFLDSLKYFFSFAMGAYIFFNLPLLQKKQTFLFVFSSFTMVIATFLVRQNKIEDTFVHFALDATYSLFSFSLLILMLHSEAIFKGIKQYLTTLIFLGKISYGVYLFHYLIYPLNHFLHELSIRHNVHIPFTSMPLFLEFGNPIIRFFYFLTLTLIISILSFYLVEKPIMNLREKNN